MMGVVENCFSTPIYMGGVQPCSKIDQEIESACAGSVFKNDWQPDNDTAHTTFNPDGSVDVIQEFKMCNLESALIEHSVSYLNQCGYSSRFENVRLFGSWLNTFQKDQLIGFHQHGYQPDMFSGCYYCQAPERSGNIQFKSINPFVVSFPHHSEVYSNLLSIEPKNGMVLLFPSWLMHKVLPNKSEDVRISLAFNVYFDLRREE